MTLTEYLLQRHKVHLQDLPPIILAGSRWNYLPALLRDVLGAKIGAEIGVQKGMFSERLCRTIPGLRLYAIDPWTPAGYCVGRYSQRRMDGWYANTLKALEPYNARVIRDYSANAAGQFADGSLDFVFIDADHSYEHALEDLRLWTPKVRKGGVISGHDYFNSADPLRCGVRRAVDEWTQEQAIPMWFVMAGKEHKAFYLWERT